MRIPRIVVGLVLLFLALSSTALPAAEFYASPSGTREGNGSLSAPWDLASALTASEIKPGDTLYLEEGTYRGGFACDLVGTPDAPITVRSAPGKRATIDTHPRDDRDNGLFLLLGADVVFRDFEVTCSHPNRSTSNAGPWPGDIRRGSVDVRGTRLSLINLVIHDQASGCGFWSQGEGGEIAGCLIYNNGWQGPDRGHGHGIYAQNALGTKRIVDNILFQQFGYGIHLYGSVKGSIKGFEIVGNMVSDSGRLATGGSGTPGIHVGGECPVEQVAVRDNVVIGGEIRLGYPWGSGGSDVVCTGNYGDHGLYVREMRQTTVSHNIFSAASNAVRLESPRNVTFTDLRCDENEYYITDGRWGEFGISEGFRSRSLRFAAWQKETGYDAGSKFSGKPSEQLRIFVRPNPHEAGRANVAIVNPLSLAEVDVDLSTVLKKGDAFRIVSAYDFYGPPVLKGVYDDPVTLPLGTVARPRPIGADAVNLPPVDPTYSVFVVLKEGEVKAVASP